MSKGTVVHGSSLWNQDEVFPDLSPIFIVTARLYSAGSPYCSDPCKELRQVQERLKEEKGFVR